MSPSSSGAPPGAASSAGAAAASAAGSKGLVARLVTRHPKGQFTLDARLDVAQGEVVALLGPNGAGKSTTLRILAGLLQLDRGWVVLDGEVLDEPVRRWFLPPERRPVGMVFQDLLLFPHLSVLDNVAFGPRCRGVGRRAARATAEALLERVGLADLAGRRPRALSGGQAQRVALARALAAEPRLLLLDEPLSALDARTRLSVRAELAAHLRTYDGCVVIVTHDPVDAMVLGDRLVVLEDGRVVQEGPPTEVARRPRTEYVARLIGLNLYHGTGRDNVIELDEGGRLVVAEPVSGEVFAAFRPQAVAVHSTRPRGSMRNVWEGTVTGMERLGDQVRVEFTGSPSVVADITAASVADLRLVSGARVWLAVKANEIAAYPA